ncbi:MAG: hypothetical protein JST80_02755 [Bdellovibrionales bacterium]|nr:hypothetical protein [Bdellovibrionales bacterium]
MSSVLSLFLLWSASAHAFPEMIRSGYVNCVSCHISPGGGGVLNEYGRSIVREKLAMWKSPNDENKEHEYLYGAIANASIAKYLRGGGDVRAVYFLQDDANAKQARTILMQSDAEFAVVVDKVTAVGSLGADLSNTSFGGDAEFISRNHYLMYQYDDTWRVRAGRFVPTFGILTPDHAVLTKDPLRLGENHEADAIEISAVGEQWSVFATGMLGRFGDGKRAYDSGFSGQVGFAPTERLRITGNVWYGENGVGKRWLYGPSAVWGISEQWFASTEIDFIHRANMTGGYASTQKVSFEATNGLWIYALQELGRASFSTPDTEQTTVGLGLQIFPRSHFEFNVAYEYKVDKSLQADGYDFVYLMSHFYL